MPTSIQDLSPTEQSLINAHRRLVNIFPDGDHRRDIIAAQHAQLSNVMALNMQSVIILSRLQVQSPLPPLNMVDITE